MPRITLTLAAAVALAAAASAQPRTYRIVALPDTQVYSALANLAPIFAAQTQWAVDRKEDFNIVFVSHLGDLVDNGSSATQWDRALLAMNVLDGQLPYGACPGNHDYDVTGNKGSFVNYVARFGAARYAGYSWYLGSDSTQTNHAQLFEAAPGRTFLHLSLEWRPTAATVTWAQGVIDQHPGVPTIIGTHEHLQDADTSGNGAGRTSAGVFIWDNILRTNPQILMILCGHHHRGPNNADGEYYQTAANDAGSIDFEMLSDYQDWTNGGNGWMRLIAFDERSSLIRVRTFSPWLQQYQTDEDSEITFAVDLAQRFTPAGDRGQSRLAAATFQNGANGYSGARDTELRGSAPDTPQSGAASMSIDQSDGGAPNHGLVRFDGLFGDAPGQIPSGSDIVLATLRLRVFDAGSGVRVHRMVVDWGDNATWNSFATGVSTDGLEAITAATAFSGENNGSANVPNGILEFDVTRDVRAWFNGDSNYGWALLPFATSGTNGVDIRTSEFATVAERPLLTITTPTAPVMTATFQDGVNGYVGTQDVELRQDAPTTNTGANPSFTIDSDEPNGSGSDREVLIRFGDIFGGAPGRIPSIARITSAMLDVQVLDAGSGFTVHRALTDWDESSTWDSLGGGVSANDNEAELYAQFVAGANDGKSNVRAGLLRLDVTEALQAWIDGADNRGWVLKPFAAGANNVDIASSEAASPADRPKLTVRFTAATCAGDMNCDGVVNFGDIDPFVAALGASGGVGWDSGCPWLSADTNGDMTVNFGDIDPFVARIGASCDPY